MWAFCNFSLNLLNTAGFWTFGWTKKAIWWSHLGHRETVKVIFSLWHYACRLYDLGMHRLGNMVPILPIFYIIPKFSVSPTHSGQLLVLHPFLAILPCIKWVRWVPLNEVYTIHFKDEVHWYWTCIQYQPPRYGIERSIRGNKAHTFIMSSADLLKMKMIVSCSPTLVLVQATL